ncbi:hypothetical protein NM208_g2455 [Fusarium decemcellulare]|uniref:Uncharacterized protein n=1 Tax=Fusarium decemcellulare TaxID=57161 RepID=A0ACC1SSD2_9HYPO|nr:hypothetical protein NM208_g2455 [Fusarium decemcellulare]
MLPKPFSFSLGSYLATLTIILGFFSQITQAQARKHVSEVFDVKKGTENGGCDNYRVDEWFEEALVLARHVDGCFDFAKKALEERDLDHDNDLDDVLAAFVDDEDTGLDDKPRLFCDSTFAVEKEWDDGALKEGTGEEYPMEIVNGDLRETPIMEAEAEWYKDIFTDRKNDRENEEDEAAREALPPLWYPFWVDHLKMYRFDVKGDWCSSRGNMGATEDQRQPAIVTLCPQNFKSEGNKKWYDKLDDIPEVKRQGRSIGTIALPSLTFFHEMFHVALRTVHTPDVTYKLSRITRSEVLDNIENASNEAGTLISQEQSRKNPESWTLFALAWELGERNPKFTFASTKAVRK